MKLFGLEVNKSASMDRLREDMRLVMRQIEDVGWTQIGIQSTEARTLIGITIQQVILRSRRAWIHNPLIAQCINLTTFFTFGQGITVPKANDDGVQEIVNEFWNDKDNWRALTSPQAQQLLSNKLQYDGQIFFLLTTNKMTGKLKVRILDPLTILDVIRNKDDLMRPEMYKQRMAVAAYDYATGQYDPLQIEIGKFRFIPDMDVADPMIFKIPENKQAWSADETVCIFHLKVNSDINDKWGMPETLRVIDWGNAHRDMASDLATVIKSLARWSWKKKIHGTANQLNPFKNALQMVANQSVTPPVAGSMQIENDNLDLEAMKIPTGQAEIHVTGLREMRLMLASGFGIFEHYLGDAGHSNLASTKAMELPMLKKFLARRKVWEGAFDTILQYLVDQAIIAGRLKGSFDINEAENRYVIETPIDRYIQIDFPPILDQDLYPLAQAYQLATESGIMATDTAARQFMMAVGISDIEDEIVKLEDEKAEKEAKAAAQFGQQAPGAGDPLDKKTAGAMLTKIMTGPPKKGQSVDPSKLERVLPGVKGGSTREAVGLGPRGARFPLAMKLTQLKAGLNAYESALSRSYNRFAQRLPKTIKMIGPAGAQRAWIPSAKDEVQALVEDMQKVARAYFPKAVQTGAAYVYAHVQDGLPAPKVREASQQALVDQKLQKNAQFIQTSLAPDIAAAVDEVAGAEYESQDEAVQALQDTLKGFEGRVRQYAGAYWAAEEAAVQEFGSDFGLQVNFIGPEDEHNCEDCGNAVAGGPYPIDEAPVPGEDTQCRGNCRHALQIIAQEPLAV